MKISTAESKKITRSFLDLLNKNGIQATQDLEARLGTEIYPDTPGIDHVELVRSQSNYGTQAFTAAYVRREVGSLVEIKINPFLKYSLIVLKSEDPIAEHKSFMRDDFGNLAQAKSLQTYELPEIVKELESWATS